VYQRNRPVLCRTDETKPPDPDFNLRFHKHFTISIPTLPYKRGMERKVNGERLIDYLLFYVPLKNFSLIWRRHHVTIAGEGLQNVGLCSTLRAFEQGGIFIVPHIL
jgi:hypothetical protein